MNRNDFDSALTTLLFVSGFGFIFVIMIVFNFGVPFLHGTFNPYLIFTNPVGILFFLLTIVPLLFVPIVVYDYKRERKLSNGGIEK